MDTPQTHSKFRTKTGKVSMNDVARAAGVSKTTISRFLHGEYGYMSDQTKNRIQNIIHELGYRPNRMAQGLKSQTSKMLGVAISNIGNPFSSQLLKGIQQTTRAHGVQLLVSDSDDNPAIERSNIESLLDVQVDGLIINTVGNNDEYIQNYLTDPHHKPVVLLDRFIENTSKACNTVVSDNHRGVMDMMQHLTEQGFDLIVFVTQPYAGISTRFTRVEAFQEALHRYDITGEVLVYHNDLDQLHDDIERIIHTYQGHKICIFANNDEAVRDVMVAYPLMKDDKFGLCAFAQETWARFSGRGITCLDQSPIDMGAQATELLCERIYNNTSSDFQYIEVPVKLFKLPSTLEVR
ncbi:LacI family DNA-binding transcriptional regulator [Alloscardovia criceti]|uniref:LacI family DNA-binding transcriptional regulator n=1 Tax=Alloscardovia criceti TaxID=356828 RepID=UPI00068450DB|nr:LacI family DNA-binding transcriptional regulator [Alloscardovia criceti]